MCKFGLDSPKLTQPNLELLTSKTKIKEGGEGMMDRELTLAKKLNMSSIPASFISGVETLAALHKLEFEPISDFPPEFALECKISSSILLTIYLQQTDFDCYNIDAIITLGPYPDPLYIWRESRINWHRVEEVIPLILSEAQGKFDFRRMQALIDPDDLKHFPGARVLKETEGLYEIEFCGRYLPVMDENVPERSFVEVNGKLLVITPPSYPRYHGELLPCSVAEFTYEFVQTFETRLRLVV